MSDHSQILRPLLLLQVLLFMFLVAPLCLAQSTPAHVTETNAVSWWVYSGDHRISGPWGIFTEVQARRANFLAIWQQLQFRDAATYRFSPHLQVAAGYVWTRTGQYGEFPAARPSVEHRAYQQLTVKQEFKHGDLEHRYRVEERWLQNFTTGDAYFWRQQDRFRYQLKGTLPLSLADPQSTRWYVLGAGELFVHFGPNHGSNSFDQTRAFTGLGYRVTKNNKFEVMYQHQYIAQRNGRIFESNHGLRVQWSSSTPLRKKG